MKQLLVIVCLSLTLVLSSCSSCASFPKDPGNQSSDTESTDTGALESSSTVTSAGVNSQGHESSEDGPGNSRPEGKGNGIVQGERSDSKNDSSQKSDSSAESSAPKNSSNEESKEISSESSSKSSSESSTESSSESSPESSSESSSESSGSAWTAGRKAAYEKALLYLSDGTGYSYQEMVNLLDNVEGFDHADTVFALEQTKADYKEQAVIRAKNILGLGALSKPLLKDELTDYAGFTPTEAQYAIDNCGADWTDQAKKRAAYLISKDAYSALTLGNAIYSEGFESGDVTAAIEQFTEDDWKAEALEMAQAAYSTAFDYYYGPTIADCISDLVSKGFTTSQASYGVANCGVNWPLKDAYQYVLGTITSPADLDNYLYATQGYDKAVIINILDTMSGDGIWWDEVLEAAADLAAGGANPSDIYNALLGNGYASDQAWYGTRQKSGFSDDDLCILRASILYSEYGYEYSELVQALLDEGFSYAAASEAADTLGVPGEKPKG